MKLDFNCGLSTLRITITQREKENYDLYLATKVIYQLYVFLYVF